MSYLFNNGDSEYLEVSSVPVAVGPLTYCAWFNIDEVGINNGLFGIADNATGSDIFLLWAEGSNGNIISAGYRNSAFIKAETTATYTENIWHHAAGISRSVSSQSVYLDGGNRANCTDSLTYPTSLDNMSIGRISDSTPGAYVSGMIAEVALWNIDLSDAEIAILGDGYSPLFVRPQNLVAYWPLIRNPNDIVGGYNMTEYNTPTIAAHPKIIRPAG